MLIMDSARVSDQLHLRWCSMRAARAWYLGAIAIRNVVLKEGHVGHLAEQ
jgi:hypothetical protein